jgi:DNA-binding CsgD family transcriptional regulator
VKLPKDTLTPRERRTVELVARGWSTREIAAEFGVTPKAVRMYIWRACDKIGASNRVEIALFVLHGAERFSQLGQHFGFKVRRSGGGPRKAARPPSGKESAA